MWVIIFWLKPKRVIEKIKSLKVEFIKVYIIQKQHLNKKNKDRQKLCRNYKSNVRNVNKSSIAKLPNC